MRRLAALVALLLLAPLALADPLVSLQVSLDAPGSSTFLPQSDDFSFTPVWDDAEVTLSSCDLMTNSTGTWDIETTLDANSDVINNAATNSFQVQGLADGAYLWNVYCYADNGSVSYAAEDRTVTIDSITPDSIGYLDPTPADGAVVSATAFTIRASFNDTNPAGCSLFWQNETSASYPMENESVGVCAFNASASDGAVTFGIDAYDRAGNSDGSSFRSFTIDTVPPDSAAFIDPTPPNASNRSAATIALAFNDTNPAGCVLEWDNGTAANYTMEASNSTACALAAFGNGTVRYRAYVLDAANNTNATELRELLLDPDAPAVAVTATPSSATAGSSVSLNCSAADRTAVSLALTVTLPDTTAANATCNAPFTATAQAGSYLALLNATDSAGNNVSANTTFTLSSPSPPPAPPAAPAGGGGGGGGAGAAAASASQNASNASANASASSQPAQNQANQSAQSQNSSAQNQTNGTAQSPRQSQAAAASVTGAVTAAPLTGFASALGSPFALPALVIIIAALVAWRKGLFKRLRRAPSSAALH